MEEKQTVYQEARERFVALWGDMAPAWGINKTMAQIHALLYSETEELDTDTIMAALDISRGNAHLNLQRLLEWQLVHKVHKSGDRRDYYAAEKDVWNIVSTIMRERQQQELAPIKEKLEECIRILEESGPNDVESAEFKQRMENYTEFLSMFERFSNALLPYINSKNVGFIKQLVKLVEVKDSLSGKRK